MEIMTTKYKQKCELGACCNTAAYTVRFDRAGIRSRLHLCGKCLKELSRVTAAAVEQVEKEGTCITTNGLPN